MKKNIFRSPVSKGEAEVKLLIIVCFPWNWLAQMTTTNRIISSQALIIIRFLWRVVITVSLYRLADSLNILQVTGFINRL